MSLVLPVDRSLGEGPGDHWQQQGDQVQSGGKEEEEAERLLPPAGGEEESLQLEHDQGEEALDVLPLGHHPQEHLHHLGQYGVKGQVFKIGV